MNLKKLTLIVLSLIVGELAYSQNCSLNANVDQAICANSTLTLVGASTGLFHAPQTTTWVQSAGPSAVITSPNALTTTVTGIIGGNTYKFRLTSTCQDGSFTYDEVTIVVNGITTANAGADFSAICPGTPALTLAGNAVGSGETGTWTIVSGGTGLTIVSPNSPTSAVNFAAGSAGNAVLRWTITNATTGCSTFDEVTIPKKGAAAVVSAGVDQTTTSCHNGTTTATLAGSYAGDGTGGQSGLWTVVSGPKVPTFSNAALNNCVLSNLSPGTYIMRWTVTGSCASGFDEMQIVVPNGVGTVTTATATLSNAATPLCDARTAITMVGSTPKVDETGVWTQTSGSAGPTIVSPNSPSTLITGLNGSSNYAFTYTITKTATGCTSTASKTITYGGTQSLTINTASPLLVACGTTSAVISFTAAGAGGANQYSIISGPTTPTIATIPSVYANTTTSSSLTITGLTVTGTYVVRIRRSAGNGSSCGTVYKDITVVVSQSPTASNAGSGQILACTVTNTSLIANAPSVGAGRWTQVSGPNTATIADPTLTNCPITGLTNGAYVFRWLISAGPKCATNQGDVKVTVASATPTTANAGADQDICNSTPLYLDANHGSTIANNETGTWSVSPSAGVTFSNVNSQTPTVTGLASNSTYTFTWTINNACGTSSDNAIVTTSAVVGPIAALAGADQCLPSGTTSTTMAGNPPAPGTGLWTKLTGGAATITSPNSNTTTITGMSNGTYTFEWSITRNACTITRDTMTITISAAATTANAGVDQNVCGASTTLAGNIAAVGSGTWTQTTGNGGAIITSPSSPTSTVSGLTAGFYTFRWTITNGACSSNYDEVQLNVSLPATAPSAGPNQILCGATTATMAANTIDTGTGYWSVISGPTTYAITNVNLPTTTITGLTTPGMYTFGWNSENGPYCPLQTSLVSITVNATANAGVDQTFCDATSATLTGNTSTLGTWSQVSGPNTATLTPLANSPSAVASGLIVGAYTFRYTLNDAGCASNFDDMLVTVSGAPTTANAGADLNLCNVTSFTLSASPLSTGTGAWTRIAGPNSPTIQTASSATTTVGVSGTRAARGTYVYRWTVTNGSCTSLDEVVINIGNALSTSAGANQTHVCGTSTTLAATLPANGGCVWAQVSGPNTAVFSSSISNTPTVSGLIPGDYTFSWTNNDPPCTPVSTNVTISVFANPTTPDAGPDQNICGLTTATLAGNAITDGTGSWSKLSGPACTITTPNSPTSTITGMSGGTYVFTWTSTLGTCTLTDNVTIVVSDAPTTAAAGSDFHVCLYSALNLAGNTPSVGTGTWTQISGNSVVISSPNSATASIIGATAGSYTFRWTIANGTCISSTDDVVVTVDPTPSLAVAGVDQNLCNVSSFTMAADPVSVGNGTWSNISGPNTPTITNINSATSTITGVTTGTYVFRWTSSVSGACGQFDEVTIVNNVSPTANAGVDQIVCGTSTTMAADVPGVGTGAWSKISGPTGGTITSVNSATSTITSLTSGTYVFRWTVTNGTCVSTDDVVIYKNCAPSPGDDSGTTLQNTPVTLASSLLSNDTDADNPLLATKIDLNPSVAGIQTSFTNATGTWSVNTSTGRVTFTPQTGFLGSTTIPYEICDTGTPVLCAQANITIMVSMVSDVQTYNITPSPTFTTATINWSNGSRAKRVVFMKEGVGAISNPVDGTTYRASANWGSKGDQLASSGYYCIYNGTGTSVRVINMYPGRTYTIQAFEFNGNPNAESYLTNLSGAQNPTTTVPWPTTTFTNSVGVSTQESWHTAARWDHDTIPTNYLHEAVLIYIDGNCAVSAADAACHNLTINAAHSSITPKLTINPAMHLNVTGGALSGQFVNNGAASALVIKSSATLANGSLVWANGNPSGTVELYSKASWNLSMPVNNKYKWQFMSIPVKSIPFSSVFTTDYNQFLMYEWDESVTVFADVWRKRNNGTTLRVTGGTLSNTKGYEIVQPNPTTYSFAGVLEHSDFTQSLPYTPTAYFHGQSVFGNPYTAAIDIRQIDFGANTDNTVYQYNAGTYLDWFGNHGETTSTDSTEIIPSRYAVSTKFTAGNMGLLRQIPSMQGFVVKATNAAGGSFTIPYSAVMKNTIKQRDAVLPVGTLIAVKSLNFSDKVWIFTDPSCTNGFDNGWDGKKMMGDDGISQIFVPDQNDIEAYQIAGVPDMNDLYVGFKPGNDTEFNITVTHQNANQVYDKIYLEDLVTNMTTDITTSGSTYSFTAAASDPVKRFRIVTNTTGVDLYEATKMINIYNKNGIVYINNRSDKGGSIDIFNELGNCLIKATYTPNGITTVPTNLTQGVYVIKASNNKGQTVKRIVLK
ncbi:MAG: PKD domain-containing protein [Bacteroidales bacterium]